MDDLIQQADLEYKRLRLRQAMKLYTQVYEVETDNYEARVGIALCLSSLKQYDSAIQMAHKALELKLDSAVPHSILAWSFYYQRRYPESAAEYRAALQIEPTSIPDLIMLAYAYTGAGKKDEAEAILLQAAKADSANPSVYKAMRAIYLSRREYYKSITAAHMVFTLKPSIRSAWAILDVYYRRFIRIYSILLIIFVVGAFFLELPLAWGALVVSTIMMLWAFVDGLLSGQQTPSYIMLMLYLFYFVVMVSHHLSK